MTGRRERRWRGHNALKKRENKKAREGATNKDLYETEVLDCLVKCWKCVASGQRWREITQVEVFVGK